MDGSKGFEGITNRDGGVYLSAANCKSSNALEIRSHDSICNYNITFQDVTLVILLVSAVVSLALSFYRPSDDSIGGMWTEFIIYE